MGAGARQNGITSRAQCLNRSIKAAFVLLMPVLVAGCLQWERVVQVDRDGSGILIERLVLSNEIVTMMDGMRPEGQPVNIRDDAKLRANAASFGTSVRLLSVRDLENGFGRGYEARYEFDDINSLRVGQNMDDRLPGDPVATEESAGGARNFTTFTLHRTNPAELVVHWPVDETAGFHSGKSGATDHEATSTPEQERMATEMMKTAFRGMRIAMHVEVMGDIAETSAMHASGRRVTLMDIDFGALLANETALTALVDNKPDSVADMKRLLDLVPGLIIETAPEVSILFR